MFAFLNEAVALPARRASCARPRDGDVGAIFGLGFPPFLGGPFRYLDRLGAAAAVGTLERLEDAARASLPSRRRCSSTMARGGEALPCRRLTARS